MSFFAWGNRSVESTTTGLTSNPTTSALLAEVDLNATNATVPSGGQCWGVTWIIGNGTTNATFLLDHALSTGVASTGIRNQTVVPMSSGASAQFYTKHTAEPGDRFRVRVASTFTGGVAAKIIAEPLI